VSDSGTTGRDEYARESTLDGCLTRSGRRPRLVEALIVSLTAEIDGDGRRPLAAKVGPIPASVCWSPWEHTTSRRNSESESRSTARNPASPALDVSQPSRVLASSSSEGKCCDGMRFKASSFSWSFPFDLLECLAPMSLFFSRRRVLLV
jgi:hypothetical protein